MTRRVGLFVTCLVDLFRPNVAFAAVKLLEQAGCQVEVPRTQTCCGQPAYNSGDRATTAALAEQVIRAFEPYDYVVGPSGSCLATIREHYPILFPAGSEWEGRARNLAGRCHELTSFLIDVCHWDAVSARFPHTVTYHDSCSGLRELGVKRQPRELLKRVQGLILNEMEDSEVCCGFGGTFCIKYPRISERMVSDKTLAVTATGAEVVLGGDLGCLLNIAGRLKRLGSAVRIFHVAEVLAGMADGGGLGEPGVPS